MIIEKVTRYITNDGKVFDTIEQAESHINLDEAVANVMTPLGDAVQLEYNEYVQHCPLVVEQVKVELVHLYQWVKGCDGERITAPEHYIHPMSFIGLGISTFGGSLAKAWYRLSAITATGREFSKPCYANLYDAIADKAKCVCDRT